MVTLASPRGFELRFSGTIGDIPIARREEELQPCRSEVRFQLDAVRLSNGRRPTRSNVAWQTWPRILSCPLGLERRLARAHLNLNSAVELEDCHGTCC